MRQGIRALFRRRSVCAGLGAVLGLLLTPGLAAASCLPIAGTPEARVLPASLDFATLQPGEVELTFIGHASFLIRSPGGVTAVTDYNGVHLPPEPPDIATMNLAHSTHHTDRPDPRIKHVLRGWDPDGGIAEHDLRVGDVRVFNVPTNIRQFGGTRVAGNSIFVFEVASLCIAHLGHLHHLLEPMHLDELGPIDVVLVPVDGTHTLGHHEMLTVIEQIRPSLVIPHHFFSRQRLARFLAVLEDRWSIVFNEEPSVVLSRLDLPFRQVLVLPGH